MKAQLETGSLQARGVEIVSENAEEAAVLQEIWNTKGGLGMVDRQTDGTVKLVVVPTADWWEMKPLLDRPFIDLDGRSNPGMGVHVDLEEGAADGES